MTETTRIILMAVAAGLGAIILMMIIFWIVGQVRLRRRKRLEEYTEDSGIFHDRISIRAQRPTGWARLDKRFENFIKRTQLDITAEQALAFTLLCGALMATVLYLWQDDPLMAVAGLLLGVAIPLVAFKFLSGRYRKRIQDLLPDMYFLLARSLRSGMSVPQALEASERQGVKPLSEELAQVNSAIRLGLSPSVALTPMAERLQLIDFKAFVSLLALHENVGGRLPQLLDRLGSSTRDHNQFRRQFFATTAQGRITAIILGAAIPVLLLLYMTSQPEHLEAFFNRPGGWITFAFLLLMQAIGCYWIYRILKIEY